jgi:hypothetical protein
MQKQKQYNENNIFLTSVTSGIGYTTQKYKNLTSFTYDHIWIGGDQSIYLYGIANSFKTNIYSNHILSVDLKYKKKKMIKQIDQDKNANIKEIALGYSIPLDNAQKISLLTSFETHRKTRGARIDISKDINKYKFSYSKNFLEVYDAAISYQLEKSDYKDIGTMLPKRDDKVHTLTLNLSKKLNKSQSIALELNETKAKSNINVYTYKKRSANLNFMVSF